MARKPKKSEEVEANTSEVEADVVSVENQVDAVTASEHNARTQSRCGVVLLGQRTALGLSTKEVAKQLRLSSTQIEALEDDNFSALPEATIVKGFIRNYAKLLKISAEPLLVAYAEMVPDKKHYSFTLDPGINMKMKEGKKTNKMRYVLLILALLLGGGVWFLYQSYVQKPSPVTISPGITEALPGFALPLSERLDDSLSTPLQMPESVSEQPADVPNGEQDASTENNNNPLKTESVDAETEVVAETVAEEIVINKPEEVAVDTAPALGAVRIEFSATQETWLSVVNTSGREVYNKILYAGNHDVVDIKRPREIVVGNSHGATLIVDGKAIDLAPYTRINVARVRLDSWH